ncbi:MAG: hypothetical protein PHS44_05210 [Candidatus Dojkabacteria bacterium]|nr:hypothetical protein [Candidatus Dojkabacteria bacterium]
MRKLLEIGVDAILFLFLLIIFAVPLLVSFNLDPELYYPEQPDVAGVSRVAGDSIYRFRLTEKFDMSNHIIVTESAREGNLYRINFRVLPENSAVEYLKIGDLVNESGVNARYSCQLFGTESALSGSSVWLRYAEQEQLLFDGESFKKVDLQLVSGDTIELTVLYDSEKTNHFETNLELEIRGISERV